MCKDLSMTELKYFDREPHLKGLRVSIFHIVFIIEANTSIHLNLREKIVSKDKTKFVLPKMSWSN